MTKLKHALLIIIFLIPIAFYTGWFTVKFIYEHDIYIPRIKEAVVLATTHQPETFTELYFEDHLDLPQKIELRKNQFFRFTIHNLEYQDMTYKYEIRAIDDKESRTLSSKSASLTHDEYKTFYQSFNLATSSGRMKIQVSLVNKDQPIHFWMEE